MNKHKLDIDKSMAVYDACKDDIELKMCYKNIFQVACGGYTDTFRKGNWKIAYGYVEIEHPLYARHCFIIDEEGNAIDPTAMLWSEISENYLSFAVITFEEWLDLICNNDLQLALDRAFEEEKGLVQKYAEDHHIALIG